MSSPNPQKQANKFVNKHGEAVMNMEGGPEFLGAGKDGPVKGGILADAQAYKGDVKSKSAIANVTQEGMKKQ